MADPESAHSRGRSGLSTAIFAITGVILYFGLIAAIFFIALSALSKSSAFEKSETNETTGELTFGGIDFSGQENTYNFDSYEFDIPRVFIFAALASGLLCRIVIIIYAYDVFRSDPGNARMQEIAAYIAEGAATFLRTEYLSLIPLLVVLFILLGFAQNWKLAGCYLIRAFLSGLTGYIGMSIATIGNARTTGAGADGLSQGFKVAFRAGSVIGVAVVAVAITGLSFCYLVFRDIRVLAGFSAGASTVAFLACVGGGIYTKGADVGADIVGKVEANIPEDDPRSPATIVDNFGDNVGDVAGMGAGLFESYVRSITATDILGSTLSYFQNGKQALCVFNHLREEKHLLDLGCSSQISSFAPRICQTPDVFDTYPNLDLWLLNSAFVALLFLLAMCDVLVAIVRTLYVRLSKKASPETSKGKVVESLLCSLRIDIFSAGLLVTACVAALCFGMFGRSSKLFNVDELERSTAYRFQGGEICSQLPTLSNFGPLDLDTLNDTGVVGLVSGYRPLDILYVSYPNSSSIAWRLFVCIIIGLVLGNLIGSLTEYFTAGSFSPTRGIAGSGEYNAGAVVIQGLGIGLLNTGLLLLWAAIPIVGTYQLFGTYSIALAAVGMLSTLGVTTARDSYGSVAENAGGIAEMAELDASVRDTTDALDALGNTTAATGKGFSNGSAVLTAYALLTALVQDSGPAPNARTISDGTATLGDYNEISLVDPFVVFAFLIGVCLPFVFDAFTMLAVSRAAQAMIVEVRRHFREILGLREGAPAVQPGRVNCIQISTFSSISEMVLPGALAMMAPLIIGFGFGQKALVALLLAAIVSGYIMVIKKK